MFGWEDKRTAEERKRDLDRADAHLANQQLALNFLKYIVRKQLEVDGLTVGIPGKGDVWGAEMLVESAGVTYKITVKVDHD